MTALFTKRTLTLMASKLLCFEWTHVLTINQGLEEVSWWQYNAPDIPINTLVRRGQGETQKKQASGGYPFEVCLYCFSQIKETGAFVVRGWRNVEKKLPFCVIIFPFILVSH